MKRKTAAFMLSMTLSAAMIAQTGVAAFAETDLLTSGELTGEEVPAETYEEPTQDLIITQETQEPAGDSLLLPDPQPAVEQPSDVVEQPAETPAEPAQSDELSAGETGDIAEPEVTETPEVSEFEADAEVDDLAQVFEDGSVLVGANSWEKTSAGYKLKRPAAASKAQEIPVVMTSEEGEELPAEETYAEETPAEEETPAVGAGGMYFTSEDGILKVTTKTVKGTHTGFYCFTSEGVLVTGRTSVTVGTPGYAGSVNTQMYFAKDTDAALYSEYQGVEKTPVTSNLGQRQADQWIYDSPFFFYFGEDGALVKTKDKLASMGNPATVQIGGSYYALLSSGRPRTGLVNLKGNYYFFEPGSKIPGAMVTGTWKNFNDSKGSRWLYFQPNSAGEKRGQAVKHTNFYVSKLKGSVYYLLNASGYIAKNTMHLCENGKTYGSDAQGRLYMEKLVKFGNFRYYFTKTGYLAAYKNRWARLGDSTGKRYYYFGSTPGRVVEKKGFQKLTDANGKYVGWLQFPDSGNHYRNCFVGDRYYGDNGLMYSGRRTVRGEDYFFEVSSESGYKGKMYRGKMIHVGNSWFYAQNNGKLLKEGWLTLNGNLYEFKNYRPKKSTFTNHNGTYGFLDYTGVFRTGWVVVSNTENKVRYVNPNGGGWYTNTNVMIDGLRYYFDEKGFRMNDLTHIYKSNYYVTVDRVNGVCTVYDSSRTVPVKSFRISVGAAATPTPLGTYYLRASGRWQELMGPSYGQYGTNVVGAGLGGIFFHSIPCNTPSIYGVPASMYNRLGNPASHGCIRCTVIDAKFIFERCNGATVKIFDGVYNSNNALKGPLGRNALIPMTGNYDPTDPAVVG